MDARLLGSRIRQARERLGLSQDDLAVAVLKDQRAISEYEHGSRKLSATDLPLFAQALRVPVLYFYEGEITTDDLDMLVLSQFHRLATLHEKQVALTILGVLSGTIAPIPPNLA